MNSEVNGQATLVRLQQVLQLVGREDAHLLAVTHRLFGDEEESIGNQQWLADVLSTPIGVDRLESFTGKFNRMQDTVMDKLIPRFLISLPPGSKLAQ